MVTQYVDFRQPREGYSTVTGSDAEHWVQEYQLPRQRPLKAWHVKRLAREAVHGELFGGVILFGRTPTGHMFLLDGQHRLSAVALSGVATAFHIDFWPVNDTEDAHRIYALLDQNQTRGPRIVNEARNMSEILHLSPRETEQLGAAMTPLVEGFGARHQRGGLLNRHRLLLEGDWKDEMHEYAAIMEAAHNRTKFLRAPLLAVALVTLRYQNERARQFWGSVAADQNLSRDTPERHVINAALGVRKLTPREFPRVIARCWNLWCDGQKAEAIRVGDLLRPIRIDGTPFDGKQARAYDPESQQFVLAPEVFADVER